MKLERQADFWWAIRFRMKRLAGAFEVHLMDLSMISRASSNELRTRSFKAIELQGKWLLFELSDCLGGRMARVVLGTAGSQPNSGVPGGCKTVTDC